VVHLVRTLDVVVAVQRAVELLDRCDERAAIAIAAVAVAAGFAAEMLSF